MISSELPPLQNYAIGLMVFGAFFCVVNWLLFLGRIISGRFVSVLPLIGALPLGLGALYFPATRPFAWLALLLDFGTLELLMALPWIVNDLWSTSRFNLLEEYRGRKNDREAILRLYRNGICILQQYFQRSPGELGISHISLVGDWEKDGTRLVLRFGGETDMLEAAPDGKSLTAFSAKGGAELSLAGMQMELVYRRTHVSHSRNSDPRA